MRPRLQESLRSRRRGRQVDGALQCSLCDSAAWLLSLDRKEWIVQVIGGLSDDHELLGTVQVFDLAQGATHQVAIGH